MKKICLPDASLPEHNSMVQPFTHSDNQSGVNKMSSAYRNSADNTLYSLYKTYDKDNTLSLFQKNLYK